MRMDTDFIDDIEFLNIFFMFLQIDINWNANEGLSLFSEENTII